MQEELESGLVAAVARATKRKEERKAEKDAAMPALGAMAGDRRAREAPVKRECGEGSGIVRDGERRGGAETVRAAPGSQEENMDEAVAVDATLGNLMGALKLRDYGAVDRRATVTDVLKGNRSECR